LRIGRKPKSAEILVIGISYLAILTVDGLRAGHSETHPIPILNNPTVLCANIIRGYCGIMRELMAWQSAASYIVALVHPQRDFRPWQ
jgi:hypothetical protein